MSNSIQEKIDGWSNEEMWKSMKALEKRIDSTQERSNRALEEMLSRNVSHYETTREIVECLMALEKKIAALDAQIVAASKDSEAESTPASEPESTPALEVSESQKTAGEYIADFCLRHVGKVPEIYAMLNDARGNPLTVPENLGIQARSVDLVRVILKIAGIDMYIDENPSHHHYQAPNRICMGSNQVMEMGSLIVHRDFIGFFVGRQDNNLERVFSMSSFDNPHIYPISNYVGISKYLGYVRIEEPIGWTPPRQLVVIDKAD